MWILLPSSFRANSKPQSNHLFALSCSFQEVFANAGGRAQQFRKQVGPALCEESKMRLKYVGVVSFRHVVSTSANLRSEPVTATELYGLLRRSISPKLN